MSTAIAPRTTRLAPLPAAERVELIDVLRGFAVLGILLVNFVGAPAVAGEPLAGIDASVREWLNILVSGSFYPMFSLLFGLGFAVQLHRARARGAPVLRVYVRRLLALFLIGTFHGVLLWNGDVLVPYALLGFLLLPLYRIRDRWLLPIPIAILALQLYDSQVTGFLERIGSGNNAVATRELQAVAGADQSRVQAAQRQRVAVTAGDRAEAYRLAVSTNWRRFAGNVRARFSPGFFLSTILAFFLLGLIVGRRGWLQEAVRHRRLFAWAAAVSVVAAVAGNLAIRVWKVADPPWEMLALYGGNLGATVFYVAAIALVFTSLPRVASILRIFAAPGRIALTNYLMQSVVMVLLFAPYGARLSRPGTTMWLLLDLAFFFVVQVTFSIGWTKRFRFGPAEWMWRSMTYGRWQPIMLKNDAGVAFPASPEERKGVPEPAVAPQTMQRP